MRLYELFFALVRILMKVSSLEVFGEKNEVCCRRIMRWNRRGGDS